MKKILFVCLGNICRSPAAEGIFRKYLHNEKLDSEIFVDSAGLLDYHEGETYDNRMIMHAAQRGFNLDGVSRPFVLNDFEEFDMILTMDDEVYNSLLSLDKKKNYRNKIYKMTDFYSKKDYKEVPDPYYSSSKGFEIVLDILEDACWGLLKKLKEDDTS
jgi:protein-tyrosine phosphatase